MEWCVALKRVYKKLQLAALAKSLRWNNLNISPPHINSRYFIDIGF